MTTIVHFGFEGHPLNPKWWGRLGLKGAKSMCMYEGVPSLAAIFIIEGRGEFCLAPFWPPLPLSTLISFMHRSFKM